MNERREKREQRKVWRFEPPAASPAEPPRPRRPQYVLRKIGLIRLGLSLLALGLGCFAADAAQLVLSGAATLRPPFTPLLQRIHEPTWLVSGFFTFVGAFMIYAWLDRS